MNILLAQEAEIESRVEWNWTGKLGEMARFRKNVNLPDPSDMTNRVKKHVKVMNSSARAHYYNTYLLIR